MCAPRCGPHRRTVVLDIGGTIRSFPTRASTLRRLPLADSRAPHDDPLPSCRSPHPLRRASGSRRFPRFIQGPVWPDRRLGSARALRSRRSAALAALCDDCATDVPPLSVDPKVASRGGHRLSRIGRDLEGLGQVPFRRSAPRLSTWAAASPTPRTVRAPAPSRAPGFPSLRACARAHSGQRGSSRPRSGLGLTAAPRARRAAAREQAPLVESFPCGLPGTSPRVASRPPRLFPELRRSSLTSPLGRLRWASGPTQPLTRPLDLSPWSSRCSFCSSAGLRSDIALRPVTGALPTVGCAAIFRDVGPLRHRADRPHHPEGW
jgi:hypothetical protein